jgi:hypothetical protein
MRMPNTAFRLPAIELFRCLLLVGLLAATAGCTGWRRMSPPAPAPDAPLRMGSARVTDIHGTAVELHSVVITADSVVGWRTREPGAGRRLALHRAQVLIVEHNSIDFARTALAILGFAAVALMQAISRGA